MSSSPDVSVIVVTFNGRDHVRRCLASLQEHTRELSCEVVVVDNASSDGTPTMIEREFPQNRLVRRTENAGFAGGVNEGIGRAKATTFFILNPDAEISSSILPPMLGYLRQHPDIGLLAPKLLDLSGATQLSCRAFPTFGTALFNRYSLLTRLFPRNPASSRYLMTDFDHNTTSDVDWASGAAWLLPRSTVELVGLLDERYFWSIEDVDYCQRIHGAGLRVVYFPDVTVVHSIGGSSSTAPSRAILARHRGMWRYYAKYLRPRAVAIRIALDLAVAGGISVRCGAQLAMHALQARKA